MSGHKPWSVIREKLRADAERRVRIERREKAIAESLIVGQMRKARDASQQNIADPSPRRRPLSPDTEQYG